MPYGTNAMLVDLQARFHINSGRGDGSRQQVDRDNTYLPALRKPTGTLR